ncbi:MAG: transposase [Actinomycetota bacterium]|nr:transposase [Actinomycetota bacterium]
MAHCPLLRLVAWGCCRRHCRCVIAELAIELDRTYQRQDALAGEIEEVFTAHPFARPLQTLPGIGARTGAGILAEIGTAPASPPGDRIASYAGLAPVTRPSGKTFYDRKRAEGKRRNAAIICLARRRCNVTAPRDLPLWSGLDPNG